MSDVSDMANDESILLVDDNAVWADAVAEALRRDGHVVCVVNDAMAAIERIRRDPPAVLVTDFLLPRVDGSKLCAVAKHQTLRPGIVTIILTGAADRNLHRAHSPHADAVIAKNSLDVVLLDLRAAIRDLKDEETRGRYADSVVGLERLHPRAVTRKLHNMKRYLDTLYEFVGDAVFEVDERGRLFRFNEKARLLFNIPREQAVALDLQKVLGVGDDHPLMAAIAERWNDSDAMGKAVVLELGERLLQFKPARLANMDGRESILLVASDITDLKKAERERLALNARLHTAEKMAALGQLTAGIAHEINNPLAALLPSLDTLEDYFRVLAQNLSSEPAAEQSELNKAVEDTPQVLADCREASGRIRDTTLDMRQFSHLQATTGEWASMEEIMDATLSLVGNEIRFRAQVQKMYGDTPKLVVNRAKLGQAFLNILLNAVQAMECDDVANNWIRVSTGANGDHVFVEIANNGVEIPDTVQTRIFDPFFTTKPVGRGTGLGLAVCYDVVRKHGGHIDVGSTAAETAFTIWIPQDTGLEVEPSIAPLTEAPPAERRRVLAIDDEPLVLRTLHRVLTKNYEVFLAESGEEALARFKESERFDLVICDLMMTGISGMDLYTEVASMDPEQGKRFVFLTGGAFTAGAQQFLASVPNPRAQKPLNTAEVVAQVARWIDQINEANTLRYDSPSL